MTSSAPASTPPADTPDTPQQFVHVLANGLTLVAERVPNVRSAALTILVPAGAASDPEGASGSATVLADWLLRGAGSRDSRALTGYLDSLGVQRGSQAETVFLRFGASMLAKNLLAVLPVYGDILRAPHLAEDGFAPAVDLAVQQIEAIDDEPSQKLGLLLRERHYGFPFGRPSVGVKPDLEALAADALRRDFARRYTPRGTILSVAGMFDFPALRDTVEAVFGSWTSQPPITLPARPAPRGACHLEQQTNQVQIGLAFDTLPENHPQSLLIQTLVSVLSGGMGARLFSEIREKQGLCYSVHAGYHSLRDTAAVFGYSGTAPDRAQRTLDSFLVELDRIRNGITADELERARIGMKSRVIMQGESSSARAGAIAHDFYHRGRPRSLAELRSLIESVTLDEVNAFAAAHPPGDLTLVTIGPSPLSLHR